MYGGDRLSAAIITGLISAGAAILVCLINNHYMQMEKDDNGVSN